MKILRTLRWVVLTLILALGTIHAGSVNLAWNPNTESNLAGYKVYYGLSSHGYTQSVNVGNVTAVTVPNLATGTSYFFAATAVNMNGVEGPYSNEVNALTTGASPTPTSPPTLSPTATVSPTPSATPPRTPTPAPNKPVISQILLANNDSGGQTILPLTQGSVIVRANLPSQNVNIEALVASTSGVSRVVFKLDNIPPTEEHTAPYAMCGDWDACPPNTLLNIGFHTLRITAYNSAGQNGPVKTIQYEVQ